MKRYMPAIAAIVIAAALGAYIHFKERGPKQNDNASEGKVSIFTFNRDDDERVEIDNGSGPLVLERKGGNWNITRPEPMRINKDAADQLMFILSDYQADRLLERKAVRLADYGLDKPAVTVKVLLKGSKTLSLRIGGTTPVENARYVLDDKTGKIYQAPEYNIKPFLNPADYLRDKSITDLNWDDAVSVKAAKGKQVVSCVREKGGSWHYENEKRACDDSAVSLLNVVTTAEARAIEKAGSPALENYGLRPPAAVIEIATKNKQVTTLNIGAVSPEGAVRVENARRKEIYTLPTNVGESADGFIKAYFKLSGPAK